jgi:serine/threonine protein kinase/tetratricopeptide (TPR) repeat protein
MTDMRTSGMPMSTDRWQHVQELFEAAIECEGEARARVLEQRCGADADLRREVESLLAAHERPGAMDRLAPAIAPAAAWARTRVTGWEGRSVGQYSVLELIDAGGMGIVYKAHDARLGRHVALKFLPPHLGKEPAAKERLLVEARAAAALDHPNICTILEIGETDDGQLFLAMPLYTGETVAMHLKRGRLRFDDALPIALQIARGLAAAHARGIVHRDVKPSNVMLLNDGTVKIVDFGIATMDEDDGHVGRLGQEGPNGPEGREGNEWRDSRVGHVGPRFGTLAYMSPEHLRGGMIDHRSDIWSLGVLLHEMLTGVRPFDADDSPAIADAILNREPEIIATSHPDVPVGVEHTLRRALAKLPENRYPSMTAFAADLMALAPGAGAEPAASSGEARRDVEFTPAADPGPITERRRAAVLVTLVSDYSSLVERMAPADARRLVGHVRDIAVDAMRRHGGLVNQAIGEEIVAVFGVPTSHDDDELRAVRGALALHARVREIAEGVVGSGATIQIQSGLHAGSVVAQRLSEGPRRYAIVGAPPSVASRLASLAAPGELMLSPDCQRLLAPFVNTAASAPVVLEPDVPPVTPFRVIGPTGLETRLEASARAGLTPYVGREADLALLESYVERAGRGEGRVIEVVGEAGVGKSRLLHELRERLSNAGARDVLALQGRCRAFGDVAPYGPFIEVVRGALRLTTLGTADVTDVVAQFRSIDASLEPFVPLYLHLLSLPGDSHPLPRHLQGEHLQAALVDAMAALFNVLSKRATLVLLLEDWHCADSASRSVLARMREIVPTERIVLIVTTRPEQSVLDQWPARGSRISLEPLGLAASAAVIEAGLGAGHVSRRLVERVFERTGGNPFFLEQICRALVEQGAVSLRGGEAVVEGGPETLSLPDTVQAVIRARLDNLEPRAREVVRVAAAFGREFEHALLADVVGPDVDLVPAIGRLSAAGLIQTTSDSGRLAYRFTHVLTQEVSYESLLAHQRKSLHAAIGRAIERHSQGRLEEHAALLAHHFSRAEAWAEAIQYGRRAAERAAGLSQFSDAFDTLEQVLQWLPHLPDDEGSRQLRADLLLQQERACETMGLRKRQQQIVGRLIAHLAPAGPSPRLAEAYLREGDLLTLLKRFNAAERALSTALRISRELADAKLERNILRSIGLLRWHEGRIAEALTLTEEALSIDRECGDDDAVAGDLVNLANILKEMGDYAGALARIEDALAMPSVVGNPKKVSFALHNLANVHRGMGNLEATLATLRLADENSARLLPVHRSFHLTSIAHIELQQGRIEAAIETYRKAIELSRRAHHAEGLAQSLRTLGEVLFELGRHGDALPYLVEAAQLFAQLEDAVAEANMWRYAAMARERTGLSAESRDAWKRVQPLCRQVGDSRGLLNAMEGVARTTRQIDGASDASVAAFEAALDMASTLGEWRRALACRNTLGILEWERQRFPDALMHYEAALLLAREQGDPVEEGVILNSVGVTLSKLNRPEDARTVLEESAALNRDTGQRLLEAHALAALGHVSRALGRLDRAVEQFTRSMELRREAGDRVGEAWMWRRIAETQTGLGNDAAARAAADAAALTGLLGGDDAALHH